MAQEHDDAMRAFGEYLMSERYLKGFRFAWRHNHMPGLFDIFDDWLVRGTATQHCATFETFLVTIISIARRCRLIGDDKAYYDGTLWPDEYQPGVPDTLGDVVDDFVFGCAETPQFCPEAPASEKSTEDETEHRVLSRARFEYYQEQHRLQPLET